MLICSSGFRLVYTIRWISVLYVIRRNSVYINIYDVMRTCTVNIKWCYMTRYIFILTVICLCQFSCSTKGIRNWSGRYAGNNISLVISADNCCILKIYDHLSGYGGAGHWIDDGKFIIMDFPEDSLSYEPTDITRFLTRSLKAESVVLEKHRNGRLFWRNRGYLIKK